MITEKENYLRLLSGEIPEFLPRYDMMGWGILGNPFGGKKTIEGFDVDEFGMVYSTSEESMGGIMPAPGYILLNDITRWRDVIKAPDINSIDWEQYAKKLLAQKDPVNNPVTLIVGDYFLKLVNFMSFTEGLIALLEEPEECYAMMEYLSDYYIELLKQNIYWLKPDVLCLGDDIAAATFPFIDLDTYRKIIKPHHKRLADLALDNNMYVTMHCCGKCEVFLDDFVDLGCSGWEPAQGGNDFPAIKKKYGRKLAIMGGWDNTGPISMPETSDGALREALINYVDTLAPGGGFAYMARVASGFGEEAYNRKMAICDDVYLNYAHDWYKTHKP